MQTPISTLALLPLLATGSEAARSPMLQDHPIEFIDVTDSSGLIHLQRAPRRECLLFEDPERCQTEFMSGGVAVGDIDSDGWPGLFLTRIDGRDSLYLNQRDGSFRDVSLESGFDQELQSNGAAFGDVDNDGDPDLLVSVIGAPGDLTNSRHRLYINDGAGHFSEEGSFRLPATSPTGINGWTVSFGDYDRDGWIDACISQWADEEARAAHLLRNRGRRAPGYFEDVSERAGVSIEGVAAFASTLADLDGDGWQDLAVAADFRTSRLFWNDGDGTFTDGTSAAGVGTDENGMGSAFGDFDLDGDLDWFVTSIYDPQDTCALGDCNWATSGNRLYRNDGGREFTDVTSQAGVRDGAWGWGTTFLDLDNDRDLDLIATNGIRFNTPLASPFFLDQTRVWENDGSGAMTEVATRVGVTDQGSGKGLASLDFDRDGDLDFVVVRNSGPVRLYRNDGGNRRAWLRIDVRGTRSNREGLGAVVRVLAVSGQEEQVREVGVGGHYLSQDERILHFGLGGSEIAERVVVEFPATGVRRVFTSVDARRTLVVRE